MQYAYLAILLGALILAGVARLVRSSGSNHILTIDYAKIGDPDQLHRWAGKRLMTGAAASGVLGAAAFALPAFAEVIIGAYVLTVLICAISIGLGARQFQRA